MLFGLNLYAIIGALAVVASLSAWALFERSSRLSAAVKLDRCEMSLNLQNDKIIELGEREKRAKAAAARARAAAEARGKVNDAEHKRLRDELTRPARGSCEAAWDFVEGK